MNKAVQIPYDESFKKKCEFANNAGFRHVSVSLYKMLGKNENEWDAATEDIIKILSDNNLKCVQTHPYYYDLRTSSEIMEEQEELAIIRGIKASGKLGAPWCALHPRSAINAGFLRTKSLEDNRKAFGTYLETAKKYNTGIAAENLPIFMGIMPSMPFYSSNYGDLCELVDSFNDSDMAICWDTGHANMVHFDQADAIKYLGKRIVCTHIHNNNKREDSHNPPDVGTIEWDKIMAAFAAIGYTGPLTLETECAYQVDDLLKNYAKRNFACLEYLEKLYEQVK